jgi:hypothetical protein
VSWHDEGPVATAIMGLTPAQRLELWTQHQAAFGMFNSGDKATIGRMCVGRDGRAATDAAADVRMELATDGLGTDEDGVLAGVATAGNRRDELARIEATLRSGRGPEGRPLTEAQRQALERRGAEIGDVNTLLTPRTGLPAGSPRTASSARSRTTWTRAPSTPRSPRHTPVRSPAPSRGC